MPKVQKPLCLIHSLIVRLICTLGRIPPRRHAQNARLNHSSAEGTEGTDAAVTDAATEAEDTTEEDTDAAMEDAVLSGAERAIPSSGRGRSSAGRPSAEPFWVRQLETDLENDK